jgi:CheY-like chemotaxis protein
MSAFVGEMKEQVFGLLSKDGLALRMEISLRLHLRFQCLSRAMDVPCLNPAFSVCRSIEGLLKKFSENPKHITDTSVRTIIEALGLLNELCKPGVRPDLAKEPIIRILVVDDEPIARRALTGALQMGFSKPLEAETGAAALELAKSKHFDLIFMDVCMPVMDGFTACRQILETSQNSSTPVVFVTSLSDDEFRNRAAESGGADYVIKPFIFMEINLKTLTMILRGRLEKPTRPKPLHAPVAA